MKAVLMHKINHILGFGDEYNGDCISCANTGSIMMDNDMDNPMRSLDALGMDKCMYQKLYCSTMTGVEDIKIEEPIVKIFPNPTNTNLLNLQINNPSENLMNFEIISPLGLKLLSSEIQPCENTKTFNLDGFASDVYVMVLNYNGIQEIKKFVINK